MAMEEGPRNPRNTKDGERAGASLAHLVKSLIGVTAEIRVVAPGGIERSLGKAKRIVDKRPKG